MHIFPLDILYLPPRVVFDIYSPAGHKTDRKIHSFELTLVTLNRY